MMRRFCASEVATDVHALVENTDDVHSTGASTIENDVPADFVSTVTWPHLVTRAPSTWLIRDSLDRRLQLSDV